MIELAEVEERLALFAEGIAGHYLHIKPSSEFASRRLQLAANESALTRDTLFLPEQLPCNDAALCYGQAAHLAAADVFVFPSKTDTFGLVLLEAMACGVPVAAYPVPGPIDVVEQGGNGMLDEDLGRAVIYTVALDRTRCRAFALRHSWQTATAQFVRHLQPAISGSGNSSASCRAVQ